MKKSQLRQMIREEIKKAFVDPKGNLKNVDEPSEEEIKAAAKLSKLGYKVEPIDRTEKLYYLELPDGRVSPASKDLKHILNIRTKYPEVWKDADLKYDNRWMG